MRYRHRWRTLKLFLPEWIRRVDAEDAQRTGEELQFFQRHLHPLIVQVAFGFGVEHGRRKAAAFEIALKLCEVNAVGGEAAQ